jgi:hypothetical protein
MKVTEVKRMLTSLIQRLTADTWQLSRAATQSMFSVRLRPAAGLRLCGAFFFRLRPHGRVRRSRPAPTTAKSRGRQKILTPEGHDWRPHLKLFIRVQREVMRLTGHKKLDHKLDKSEYAGPANRF